jgi:F0F1-type ATP synthase assembly protein I
MGKKTRHIKLALLFGAFTALVAVVVQIIAMAIMDAPVTHDTFVSAAVGGACIFVVSVLTVLFVWPRIGFEPFDS